MLAHFYQNSHLSINFQITSAKLVSSKSFFVIVWDNIALRRFGCNALSESLECMINWDDCSVARISPYQ